jgi:hypothetical protein
MTQPVRVAAWSCGACRKLYQLNEPGKAFADACCVCRQCGQPGTPYGGQGNVCRRCAAENNLLSAEEAAKQAAEMLERARRAVGRLGDEAAVADLVTRE